jgi:hypothetical protein
MRSILLIRAFVPWWLTSFRSEAEKKFSLPFAIGFILFKALQYLITALYNPLTKKYTCGTIIENYEVVFFNLSLKS